MEQQSFDQRNAKFVETMASDAEFRDLTAQWLLASSKHEYSYHFTWLGRPIIQYPQDILALQELIWNVKPDLIIETGIARGGSIVFFASMMQLLGGTGQVIGIDIDIREHNRIEIEKHPLSKRMIMLQGSSVDESIVQRVRELALNKRCIMVALDSNHTHDHVLRELQLYSPLVTRGSYLVVFDTVIEDMPEKYFSERPWDKGNNPKTAVREFLETNNRFEIDKSVPNKLVITTAPDGYLKCITD